MRGKESVQRGFARIREAIPLPRSRTSRESQQGRHRLREAFLDYTRIAGLKEASTVLPLPEDDQAKIEEARRELLRAMPIGKEYFEDKGDPHMRRIRNRDGKVVDPREVDSESSILTVRELHKMTTGQDILEY